MRLRAEVPMRVDFRALPSRRCQILRHCTDRPLVGVRFGWEALHQHGLIDAWRLAARFVSAPRNTAQHGGAS